MDLSGLEPQAPNAVISTNQSNIKDPGICLRSPIYGAGEGNRTLDVSLGSSSFAIKLHLRIAALYVPLIQYTSKVSLCQFVFGAAAISSSHLCLYKFRIDGADRFFEVCRFNADDDIDLACTLIEHTDIYSVFSQSSADPC